MILTPAVPRTALCVSLLLVLALPGRASAQERERDRDEAETTRPDRISQPLGEVLEGKLPINSVAIHVLWRDAEGSRSTDLYGSGIGIWDGRTQFSLPRAALMDVLTSVRKANFGAMPLRVGKEPEDLAELRGRVSVSIEDITQEVVQLAGGDLSEELTALARKILALAHEKSAGGTSAASLEDGLRKLVSGKLAPETLGLVVVCRLEAADASGSDGWLLRLAGQRAETQTYRRSNGYGPSQSSTLSKKEFRTLIDSFLRNGLATLPSNLFTIDYTDLQLHVLNRSKDIAARKSSVAPTEAQKEPQKAFERIREDLHAASRSLRERSASPSAK